MLTINWTKMIQSEIHMTSFCVDPNTKFQQNSYGEFGDGHIDKQISCPPYAFILWIIETERRTYQTHLYHQSVLESTPSYYKVSGCHRGCCTVETF